MRSRSSRLFRRNRAALSPQRRGLLLEPLEGRRLLASDVLVFDNPSYVDTSGGSSAESDTVQASLDSLGHKVSTFTATDASGINAALAGQDVLLIPEQERGNLIFALDTAARTEIQNFVSSGGGLIIHNSNFTDDFLNGVFGFSTFRNGTGTISKTAATVGTEFADDPSSLPRLSATGDLAGLPASSVEIYSDGFGATVALIPYGGGQIGYVGWDWFNAAPTGSQDGGWLQVLDSTVLELSGTRITGTTPADGSILDAKPTEYIVNVSEPVDPATLDAADFAVNGIAASSVAYTPGTTEISFTFETDPITTEGLQTMEIAEGAFSSASDAEAFKAFSGSFRYDAILLEVVSTDPTDGSTITLPANTLDLNFNEAYDLDSVQLEDFIVSQGSVIAADQVDADTLRLTLDGVTEEGTLVVEFDAGALTDAFGNPGAAFGAAYNLDFGTAPYPIPLAPKDPLGSLIYDPSQVGFINPVGDTDSFTIDVDSGQRMTLVVDSDASLRASVEIRNQDGEVVGSATADAAGDSLVLQNVPTHGQLGHIGPGAKTYTITLSGADDTTGGYSVQLILNAAAEEESHGGSPTSDLATAQSLEPAFMPLLGSVADDKADRPERSAVLGEAGKALYAVSRSTNQLYTIDSGTGQRLSQQTLTMPGEFVYSYSRGLAVDPTSGVLYGLLSTSIATDTLVTIDPTTAVATSVGALSVSGERFGELVFDGDGNLYGITGGSGANRSTLFSIDKSNPANQSALLTFNSLGAGGVAFNPDDGLLYRYQRNLFQSIDLSTTPPEVTSIPLSGSLPNVGQGMVYSGDGQFLLSGNNNRFYTLDTSGAGTFVGFHDVSRIHGLALVGGDSSDFFSFEMVAGESLTLALTTDADMELALFDPSGTQMAIGKDAGNVSDIISNYIATTTGTHYARVTAGSIGEYSLVATRNADFDTEGNSSIESAQDLISNQVGGRRWVLGYVSGEGQLLAADNGDRNLLTVDPATGEGTIVASNVGGGQGFNALARNPVTGLLYGTQSLASQGLYLVDPSNYSESFVGTTGGRVRAMAWSPDGSTLYAFRDFEFGTIDPDTAAFTSIGSPGLNRVGGMAFQPGTGTLYAVTNIDVGLHTIDLATGASTFVGNPGDRFNSLEFLSDGTLLAGVANAGFFFGEGSLVELDPASATPTFVGNTISYGNRNFTGLEELPATSDFYRVEVDDKSTLEIETRTPSRQTGEFVNNLDPMVRVYDSAGNLLAEDDNGDPDGRNAKLKYRVPDGAAGTYYIEVLASTTSVSSGEYSLSVKKATGELPAFEVVNNDLPGERVRGPLGNLTLEFNDTVLLTTLEASDLTVNGVPATSITVIDGNTVQFGLPTLEEGEQVVRIAEGALSDVQGTPLDAYELTFYHDITAPTVIASSVEDGEVLEMASYTRDLTLTLEFSEPMNTGNLTSNDFRLDALGRGQFYAASSFTYNATGTVLTLEYADLPEDNYRLQLFSNDSAFEDTASPDGWNLDGDGNGFEGGTYFLTFSLDISSVAYPVPMTPIAPLGSLIYATEAESFVQSSSDSDSFTIDVDPGQTISVLLTPISSGLVGSVELTDPDGASLALATASGPGESVVLQTVAAVEAGTYTVVVSGDGGSTGRYTTEFVVNTALELETHGGPSNNGSAQDIDASMVQLLKGATRGAVLGTADGPGNYEASAVLFEFEDISATGNVVLTFGDDTFRFINPATDGFEFDFYGQTYASLYASSNGLITFGSGTSTLSNNDLRFPFQAAIAPLWDDLYVRFPGKLMWEVRGTGDDQRLIIQWEDIQYYSSSDLITFQAVLNESDSSIQFNYLDLDGGTNFRTEGSSATVGVKDQGTGDPTRLLVSLNDGPNTFVGTGKSTRLALTPPPTDNYSFTVSEGDQVTLALEGLSAGSLELALVDADGTTILASGVTDQSNVDLMVYNFGPLSAGTYYAQVSGGSNVEYSLVVTRDAVFDQESNGTFDTAQNFDGVVGSLGYISSSADAPPVVPNNLEDVETFSGNAWPFHIGQFGVSSMRYQQIYSGSEFDGGGVIDALRFRRASGEGPFTSTEMDLTIRLGYAARTVATASPVFADNLGSGVVTVWDGPLTLSSSAPNAAPQAFDILIDVLDVFDYDPAQGDLIMDVQMRNSPVGGFFAATPLNYEPATTRIFRSGVNSTSGQVGFTSSNPGPYGLITKFDFVPDSAADWYSVTLAEGQEYSFPIITPGDGAGEFVNTLNPKIELYNPGGSLVASGVVEADGRNETITYTVPVGEAGLYRIRVTAEEGSRGEYFLDPFVSSEGSLVAGSLTQTDALATVPMVAQPANVAMTLTAYQSDSSMLPLPSNTPVGIADPVAVRERLLTVPTGLKEQLFDAMPSLDSQQLRQRIWADDLSDPANSLAESASDLDLANWSDLEELIAWDLNEDLQLSKATTDELFAELDGQEDSLPVMDPDQTMLAAAGVLIGGLAVRDLDREEKRDKRQPWRDVQ